MKTQNELYNMDKEQLIMEVLALQNEISNKTVCEFKSSLPFAYHFAGNELLKLSRDNFMGSGVILSVSDLKGKPLLNQVCLKDGFSNKTINTLLDDMQYSYDLATSFEPIKERLELK